MKRLTSEEVQDMLRISRATLYLWVRRGKLKPERAGRALLFDEEEIMKLLGKKPVVEIWFGAGATLDESRSFVRDRMRGYGTPTACAEYLDDAVGDRMRVRVVSFGGRPVEHPDGGDAFVSFQKAMVGGQPLFLGNNELTAWAIDDVRCETQGASYIALVLKRVVGDLSGSGRENRVRKIFAEIRDNRFRGALIPYRREDIHERIAD